VIVGNKCDMEHIREVPTEMGKKYADKFGIPFFETSAKLRTNVEEAFLAVVKQIVKYNPEKTKKKYKKDRRSLCDIM
jgi:GTPase SAR1 family protein